MASINAHILTISIVGINGKNVANILVQVYLTEEWLIYPINMPTETLLPTVLSATTDASGIATFNLLPSATVGNYKVIIGSYQREIEMPANDARFSELPEVSIGLKLKHFCINCGKPCGDFLLCEFHKKQAEKIRKCHKPFKRKDDNQTIDVTIHDCKYEK